jgi:phosphatidylserine decarboxylase
MDPQIRSVQPGGGFCVKLELAWAAFRRGLIRTFRPGYVRHMTRLRQGDCPNCPHVIIDSRDLKYYRNVCGYWFKPEDDRFRWRDHLYFARPGFIEMFLVTLAFFILLGGLSWLWFIGVHAAIVGSIAAAALIVWLELIFFFRNPRRVIPTDSAVLVSPADGTITHIGEVAEPDFPNGRAYRISIFLSVFNVHVNRTPRRARVTRLRYFPGQYLNAMNPESAIANEQLWIDLEDAATGQLIRVKQIAGLIARRIVCWLKPGDEVQAGELFGMIKFGSRTDVLLPVDWPIEQVVRVGDKVRGGATVLLRFREK